MWDKFVILLAALVSTVSTPIVNTAALAASGWLAAYFYGDTYAAVSAYFNWPFEAWQTGAFIGFTSGLLVSSGLKWKG